MQPRKLKAKSNIDLATSIIERFSMSQQWREAQKTKWDRYYNLYRGVLDEKDYPWQSNIFVPYPFSTVETLVPRLTSQKPQIDVMPVEPEDSEKAKVMNDLIDFQWVNMNAHIWMPEAVRSMLIYGTVILKCYWKKEVEKKQVFENVLDGENVDPDLQAELGQVKVENEVVTYDAPCVDVVDLYDFFIDPRATTIENAEYVIHRTYRSLDYLKDKQKQGIYKNINLVENTTNRTVADDEKEVRRSAAGYNDPSYYTPDDNQIEIIEYWEDGRVISVANRSVIIRDEENPYEHGKKPFTSCVMIKVPHEFYGIGILEPVETLIYELNDRRNQRMDNVTLTLNKQWIVLNGANVDEDELISTPGGVIHSDRPDGVTLVQQSDVTSSSYQEETLIKADIQQTTGVSDFTQGVGSDALANDTATGISLIQEAGNARFKAIALNIEEMMLRKIGEMMVAMNLQYMTQETVMRIVGQDGATFVNVSPEEIRGNFDVMIKAGSTLPVNDAVEKKQTMELFQLFRDDPSVNQVELKKMVAKKVMPSANIEKLFTPEQPAMMPGMEGLPPEAGQPSLGGGNTQQDIMASAMSTNQGVTPQA